MCVFWDQSQVLVWQLELVESSHSEVVWKPKGTLRRRRRQARGAGRQPNPDQRVARRALVSQRSERGGRAFAMHKGMGSPDTDCNASSNPTVRRYRAATTRH